MNPEYTTATGAPGQLAELMTSLAREIWGCDWAGGQEHHLWSLYLDALSAQDRPARGSTGARIVAFGALVTATGGLWIWPFEEPGPRWASIDEHLRRHEAWMDRRPRAG